MTKRFMTMRLWPLLGLIASARPLEAFLPGNIMPYSALPQQPTCIRSTELNMGLRSFIKQKVLRRDRPEDGPGSKKQTTVPTSVPAPKKTVNAERKATPAKKPSPYTPKAPSANSQSNKYQSSGPKTVRMGEDPRTGEINVQGTMGPETVQERIHRIKRGEMSNQEKEAFLKSALSTGNTPESRLPMVSGSGSSTRGSSASPFPTDSILRNMARGGKPASEDPSQLLDSQSMKRKYLDMVTDPDRFNSYKSSGAKKSASENSEDETIQNGASEDPSKNQPNIPKDLGARLEAAAMATEQRNAELRKQQQEKENQMERLRLEREKRLQEAQMRRAEELAKREGNILQRKKAQEREDQRKAEQAKKAEEARRVELMKAQDDYWAKKLAESKKAEVKSQEQEKVIEEKDEETTENVANQDFDDQEESEPEPMSRQARYSENNMINRAVTDVFGQLPLNDLNDVVARKKPKAASGLMDDDAKKEAERDKMEQDQLSRLKSLNSPLPRKGGIPTIKKAKFQPQMPVTARGPSPSQSLGDLSKTIQNSKDSTSGTAKKSSSSSASSSPFLPFSGNKRGNTSNSSPAKPAPAAPPQRKGPIRMTLPLGDEDEEPAMTDGMTIGEIMKRQRDSSGTDQEKRSKQWGVDMSRFQD